MRRPPASRRRRCWARPTQVFCRADGGGAPTPLGAAALVRVVRRCRVSSVLSVAAFVGGCAGRGRAAAWARSRRLALAGAG
eukprot:4610178-Lingulodinium_polyedra.AAC.1